MQPSTSLNINTSLASPIVPVSVPFVDIEPEPSEHLANVFPILIDSDFLDTCTVESNNNRQSFYVNAAGVGRHELALLIYLHPSKPRWCGFSCCPVLDLNDPLVGWRGVPSSCVDSIFSVNYAVERSMWFILYIAFGDFFSDLPQEFSWIPPLFDDGNSSGSA